MPGAGLDGQHKAAKRPKRGDKLTARQLVANLAALSDGRYQPPPSEAAEVVGDVRATGVEGFGELCWVGRPIQESNQDTPPGGVGKGCSNTTEDIKIGRDGDGHTTNDTPAGELSGAAWFGNRLRSN